MGLSELIQRYQTAKNTIGNTKNTKENLGVPAESPVFTGWNTKNTKNTTFNRSPFSISTYQECKSLVLMPPHALLVRVANLLGVHRDYLLEQGFLDAHDLEEQAGADPLAIAALIRTSPRWIDRKAPAPTKAPPVTTESKGTPEAHAIHWSAAMASPEWLQARDAFHNHLAACPDCWAPIGRYCSEGGALRQRYQELMPTENIHGQANH